MIGDSENDIIAARRAGIDSVLILPPQQTLYTILRSSYAIGRFEEMIRVQILWLEMVNLCQTFADLDEMKDRSAEVRVIRKLLDEIVDESKKEGRLV
jgi:hypothetical protein